MKSKESVGKELFNLTSVMIGAFLLVVGIAVGLILNSNSTFALDTSNLKYGDLNCDGEVTSADMVTLARAVKGMVTLTEEQKLVADVNTDGKVDKNDELILAKYIVNYDSMTLPYTGAIPGVVYGDINLDGNVTSADAVVLTNYIAGKITLTDEQKINADLNLDGNIDNCDKDILSRYLVNEVTLPYVTMATSSNATSSNATSSNATATNATSSNAVANDNILFLTKIELKNSEANVGGKVSLTLDVQGTCNSGAKVYFMNFSTDYSFGVDVKDLNTDNPYIVIPTNIPGGVYRISEVVLYGLNSDNTTFTKVFSSVNPNADVYTDFLGEDKELKVNRDTSAETDIRLGSVSLSKSSAKIGEQVNVNIEHKDNMFDMTLVFKSDNEKTFKVYLNRFNIMYEGCYFIVPTNVVIDTYYLFQIVVSDGGTTTFYTRGDNLADIALEITANKMDTYTYSNINFGEDQIKEIYDAPDDTKIVIDANVKPIIDEKVFEAIKGTDKQLVIDYQGNEIVFNGDDITNPKTIDVSISIDNEIKNTDDNKELSEMVKGGVVINLSSNGALPGKAVYRIYATDEMKTLLGSRNIYLYYYDEINKNFNLIQTNVKLNGNYYELSINHNSKYVLTKDKIDSQYVVKASNNIVDFQNSDTVNILLIVCGVGLILVVVIIILMLKKKNKK